MLKFLATIALLAAIAIGGYFAYQGFSNNPKNTEAFVSATHNVVDSVADAIKDGTTEVMNDVSAKATEAVLNKADSVVKGLKEQKDKAVDSINAQTEKSKSTVKARVHEVRQAVNEKMSK